MVNFGRKCGNSDQKTVIAFHKVLTVPISQHLKPDKITGYFERFGAIESIEVYTKNAHQFGSIEFKSSDAVKRVLLQSIHHISSFAALRVNLATGQDSVLLTLNDDCLRKIFQYLNLKDLSKAADVCIRFNQLAVEAFIANHRQNVVKIDFKNYWTNSKYFRKIDEIEAILRNFGSLLQSLEINNKGWINKPGRMFGTITLNVASEHITSGSLKELSLTGINFNEEMTNIRPLFKQLEVLSLTNCTITNNPDEFLRSCNKLKVLRLTNCELTNGNIDYPFPKLQELHFIGWEKLQCFHLYKLIRLNPTLKKLKLEFDGVYSVDFFDLLRKNLPNLMELDIKQSFHSFDSVNDQRRMARSLGRLKSLKVLKFNYISTTYFIASLLRKFVENNVAIEHLELFDECFNDHIIASLTQLKHLKCIKLNQIYNLFDDNVIELAKELPQLEQLHLQKCLNVTFNGIVGMVAHANKLSYLLFYPEYGLRLNKENYQKILQSIQHRPKKLQLTIETKSRAINVPVDAFSANQQWLNIQFKQKFKKLDLLCPFRLLKLTF